MKINKKRLLYIGVPVLILVTVLILGARRDKSLLITTPTLKGAFEVQVFSSGQIASENRTDIMAPPLLADRTLGIWGLQITELVEEGTYVKKGDFVARLDQATVQERIKNLQDDLEAALSSLEDAKIDSNMNLSNLRDVITNSYLDLEERKIVLKESIYESPSVQKKAQMDLDKSERKFEQDKKAYVLREQQEVIKVKRYEANCTEITGRLEKLDQLYNSLIITSPAEGIVTYIKHPWGIVRVGSEVSGNNPVATIPDMGDLISTTFINEIDISKVKQGQEVTIGVDAFPEKQMKGSVQTIANVGQNMPNSDAKVFEVKIKVFGNDPDLKPAMTTSNTILTNIFPDTTYIPVDAVFQNDTLQYVYVDDGRVRKQVVALGEQNENFVIVSKGLVSGDMVCLTEPNNAKELPYAGLEIYEEIRKERQRTKQQERDSLLMEMKRDSLLKNK